METTPICTKFTNNSKKEHSLSISDLPESDEIQHFLNRAKTIIIDKDLDKESKGIKKQINNLIGSSLHSIRHLEEQPEVEGLRAADLDHNSKFHINSEDKNSANMIVEPDKDTNLRRTNSRVLVRIRSVFDSIAEEENWEEDEGPVWYVLDNNSRLIRTWQSMMFYFVLYTILFTPIKIAFSDSINSASFDSVDIIVDCCYIFDFIINFFIAFRNNMDEEIRSLKMIALNYLTSFFFLDLVCAFPIGLVGQFLDKKNSNNFYQLLLKIGWVRMFRIYKLSKSNDNGQEQEMSANNLKNKMKKFVYALSLVFTTLHIFSSFYIFLGKLEQDGESWIGYYKLESAFEIYIASLYFHLVTMFSVGYGDILPITQNERIYIIIFLFISVLVYSCLITVASTYFSQEDERTVAYQKKIKQLDQIHAKHNLSSQMFDQIKRFINNHHEQIINDRYEFLETLPIKYKRDMLFVIHGSYLKDLKIFKNSSHDFILSALMLFKPIEFTKGETVIGLGDYVDEMYVVISGQLSVCASDSLFNIRVGLVDKYEHIGEFFMFLNEQFHYKLVNKRKLTKTMILKKNDFVSLKEQYKHDIQLIINDSERRIMQYEQRTYFVNRLNEINHNEDFIKKGLTHIDDYIYSKGFDTIYNYSNQEKDIRSTILDRDLEKILSNLKKEVKKKKNATIKDRIERTDNTFLSFDPLNIEKSNEISSIHTSLFKPSMTRVQRLLKDEEPELNSRKKVTTKFKIEQTDFSIGRSYEPPKKEQKVISSVPLAITSISFEIKNQKKFVRSSRSVMRTVINRSKLIANNDSEDSFKVRPNSRGSFEVKKRQPSEKKKHSAFFNVNLLSKLEALKQKEDVKKPALISNKYLSNTNLFNKLSQQIKHETPKDDFVLKLKQALQNSKTPPISGNQKNLRKLKKMIQDLKNG